ncbi:LPS export ABC transporter ATP-binding protein [Fimbriimonas ginsengisoli]|uniref:Lipopolysaccharide ABC transporter, ATP-binding protein LptB n=1 Tax=Fimbriimonas ginsengisoli Gsoil 348 TaxID=661478 RepID=A0A068NQB3_FIMGI|nr:Lipopolysaccharide ABC transporter, ATP-binding protein LptB [Fimbriimonas ginsengisoli Gsoil 348]
MKIVGKDLVKVYKGRRVVNEVSYDISQGEIVGLLGPNGAGKTTTFYMTVGLVKPTKGRVFFDDVDVTKWPMYKRARAGVGYLPQEPSVFRKLTVEDNLRLVLQLAGRSRREIKEKIAQLSDELHIRHILQSTGNVLSGGERRRVEIARALATEPKFILLDEPFTGIDPVTIEEIQEILFRLRARNIGILITDHNISATLRITDRNYILIGGEIFARGTGQEIAGNEGVRKHYLGAQFGTDIFAGRDPDAPAIEAAEGDAGLEDQAPTGPPEFEEPQ